MKRRDPVCRRGWWWYAPSPALPLALMVSLVSGWLWRRLGPFVRPCCTCFWFFDRLDGGERYGCGFIARCDFLHRAELLRLILHARYFLLHLRRAR